MDALIHIPKCKQKSTNEILRNAATCVIEKRGVYARQTVMQAKLQDSTAARKASVVIDTSTNGQAKVSDERFEIEVMDTVTNIDKMPPWSRGS